MATIIRETCLNDNDTPNDTARRIQAAFDAHLHAHYSSRSEENDITSCFQVFKPVIPTILEEEIVTQLSKVVDMICPKIFSMRH